MLAFPLSWKPLQILNEGKWETIVTPRIVWPFRWAVSARGQHPLSATGRHIIPGQVDYTSGRVDFTFYAPMKIVPTSPPLRQSMHSNAQRCTALQSAATWPKGTAGQVVLLSQWESSCVAAARISNLPCTLQGTATESPDGIIERWTTVPRRAAGRGRGASESRRYQWMYNVNARWIVNRWRHGPARLVWEIFL